MSKRYELGSGARIFDTHAAVQFRGRFSPGHGVTPKERHAFARLIVDALNAYDDCEKRIAK